MQQVRWDSVSERREKCCTATDRDIWGSTWCEEVVGQFGTSFCAPVVPLRSAKVGIVGM